FASLVIPSVSRVRIRRVARGLLSGQTRPRYLAAVGIRVRRARPVRVDGTCSICLSTSVEARQVTYVKNTKKSFLVQICQQCGYIANPENFNDYTKYKALTQFPLTARVGTDEQPGREFSMAKMGVRILGG